ncbi:MAG TPA: HlyD family secretion protein [Stellaceae bacterium]|jgi:membrane fusion protein (multidrug efflux system)|nr:HlyD family secretion protein [Stellaceae bacterium]
MNGEPHPTAWRRAFEVSWRILMLAVALACLVIITTRWNIWVGGPGWQTTDDAYLQADLTPITAKVAGYVREVPVQDYQRVTAGQLIAQIVDDDYKANVAQAEANLTAAEDQVRSLAAQQALQKANVDAAKAVMAVTTANLAQNKRDIARQRKLFASGSSSVEATENVTTGQERLDAQLAQNRAQVQAATHQLDVLAANQAQAEANVKGREAALRLAQINLGYTHIVAPQDGVINRRQVLPGQYVSTGSQITTLVPLPHIWVIANYKETQLTHMAAGDKAEITVDTFPGHTLHGHVIAFAPGAGSQFALLPPDNATGNFTKVVQRIGVKILIDDADGLIDSLRPGMSVVARVDARGRDDRSGDRK